MDIEAVTDMAVAVRFGRGELRGDMSAEEAKRFVAGLLSLRGMEAWRNIEVDLFSLSGSLLLIARPSHELRVYEFTDFEALLAAAFASGEKPDSRLTYCGGAWYISFTGDEPSAFREYGEPAPEDSLFAAYLAEHGRLLIETDAIAELAAMFGKTS